LKGGGGLFREKKKEKGGVLHGGRYNWNFGGVNRILTR